MNHGYCTFRQPQNVGELKALFELRYQVYLGSRLQSLVSASELGFSIDYYDFTSYHFGLWHHDGIQSQPIGYVRVVTDSTGPSRNLLCQVASSNRHLLEAAKSEGEEPYPLMQCAPYAESVRPFYHELKRSGRRLVEISRFSLDYPPGGKRMAFQMICCMGAITLVHNIDETMMCCTQNHADVYRLFNCSILPGTTSFVCPRLNSCNHVIMVGSATRFPLSVGERVSQMAKAYRATGEICLNPQRPEDYFPTEARVEMSVGGQAEAA